MKYLGIDYGAKKIGIAVSDDMGKLAFPYSVIPNDENLLAVIGKIVEDKKVNKIVIGESKNFSGEPNKIMAEIEKFKKTLEERIKRPVLFEPEFLTSAQAEKIQGRNEMHDASAAAVILQSYLDSCNSTAG